MEIEMFARQMYLSGRIDIEKNLANIIGDILEEGGTVDVDKLLTCLKDDIIKTLEKKDKLNY